MNKLLSLLIIIPLSAQSFSFHGIKSGMTKLQVNHVLLNSGVSQNKHNQVVLYDDLSNVNNDGVVIKSPSLISFRYNERNELYQLKLNYRYYLSTLNRIGLKEALEERYREKVTEVRIKIESETVDTLAITLTDKKKFKATILRIKKNYLNEI